jgi:hypothetical protein
LPLQEIEIRLPDKDHRFQKTTILDDVPRGLVLYLIHIQDKTTAAKPHMLGASSPKEIEEWTVRLNAAKAAFATAIPT